MRIHALQHVEFEDPAFILDWAKDKGHAVTCTNLFAGEELPSVENFDLLVIMGGPMNIYEHEEYSWLAKEKEFIRSSISEGKAAMGICLGAQLIADVLGGKVTRNKEKEIGWMPVSMTEQARTSVFMKNFPRQFTPLHWHGDTFSIPPGAIHLAESEGCANQAFEYEGRVLALQFHLEATPESVRKLLANCASDLTPGKYVQSEKQIVPDNEKLISAQILMSLILNRFVPVLSRK